MSSALDILHLLPQGQKRKLRLARNAGAASGMNARASGQGARASEQGAEASGHAADASEASGLVVADVDEHSAQDALGHRRRDDQRRRRMNKGKTSRLKRKTAFKQLRAQSLQHNRSGCAHTGPLVHGRW